jgi:hypothetical protein
VRESFDTNPVFESMFSPIEKPQYILLLNNQTILPERFFNGLLHATCAAYQQQKMMSKSGIGFRLNLICNLTLREQ